MHLWGQDEVLNDFGTNMVLDQWAGIS